MGAPSILAENFFSGTAFPAHVATASEEVAGAEAFRVGTGRRHPLTNRWTAATANVEHWIQVTADRLRGADMLAIDRGHNLGGHDIELRVSDDDFATHEVAFAATIPDAPAGGGSLDDGVLTEEGAYLRRFDLRAGAQWRLVIPAMGADLRPVVVGLYLGLSWRPVGLLDLPWAEDESDLRFAEARSDAGWSGAANIARGRVGELHVKLDDFLAYDLARLNIEGHFGARRPAWIVYDDAQADRAVLAVRPQGRAGWRFDRGWAYRRSEIQWQEHEPRLL